MKKQNPATKALFKVIVYAALIVMTISIIIPVAWVFMASFKRNAEFIGKGTNPWALPEQLQWQNYVTAFVDAEMGKFFLNSHRNSAVPGPSSGDRPSGGLCAVPV